jgi:hypothetical protein
MAGPAGSAADMQQVQVLHDQQRLLLLRNSYGRILRLNVNNHGELRIKVDGFFG